MKLRIVSACAAGTLLAACASAPPKLEFSKPGVAQTQVAADSDACWNYALNTEEGRQKAATVNGSRIVGGGLAAAANMAAEKQANGDDPTEDLGNWSAHNECMGKKGYTQKMIGR